MTLTYSPPTTQAATYDAATVYARLRVSEPARWRAVAGAWRRWAATAGELAARLSADAARLAAVWRGVAAEAAAARLAGLRRRLVLFRVLCWRADQATSEFAAGLERARRVLARARSAADHAGLTIDDNGVVRSHPRIGGFPPSAALGPSTKSGDYSPSMAAPPGPTAGVRADLVAALAIAAEADEVATARLTEAGTPAAHPRSPARPSCAATPAEVRRWWAGLDPGERHWLLATEPAGLAPLDGLPAADRDVANRLLLDASGRPELAARLADEDGPRAYLLRLDPHGDGRIVLALGDPDRADTVLTHVPGMTAGLASSGAELGRAERVTGRVAELAPAAATSAVLWLDYDAPDFVDEAASGRPAAAGAPALRRFQDGLRAAQETPGARHIVLGHSYGSLVVGKAATGTGLDADGIVFVGSPGVGVRTAGELAVPADKVWASTSRSDIIQYAAVSPGTFVRDLALPAAAPALAIGSPERELWFGRNPSDPSFGAHVFPSRADAGHLGYWDRGSPSLDAMAAITLGPAR
jgi:hypothetical protein